MKPLTGTKKEKAGILFAYFLIYVVWGSTYYFIGVVLSGLPPFLLGAIRFSTAGLLLLAGCSYRDEPVLRKSLIKKSAVSGIVLLFVDMAVVMLAQQYVSSSLVAIVASSTALWILVFDVPRWKISFRTPAIIIGSICGFLGVAMLYIEQFSLDTPTQPHREYGILLLIFGCISWALGTLYTKYHACDEEQTHAFAGSAWQMLFASAMFWTVALCRGEIARTDLRAVPPVAWQALLYLILFGSVLAYSAYIWLLKVRPATEVATHAYVNPFVAVFIGITFGKENVTGIQIAGLVMILLSILLINQRNISHP